MPLDGARHGGARSCKGRGKLKFRMVSSVSCQRKNVYECKHSILDSNSIFSRWKLIMHLMKTNDRQPLRNAALFASGRKARNCGALYQIAPSGPSVASNNRPICFGHEMTGLCIGNSNTCKAILCHLMASISLTDCLCVMVNHAENLSHHFSVAFLSFGGSDEAKAVAWPLGVIEHKTVDIGPSDCTDDRLNTWRKHGHAH